MADPRPGPFPPGALSGGQSNAPSGPWPTMAPEPTDAPGFTGPAPGWYHDDNGVIRWWNGAVWDVGAPPPYPAPAVPLGFTENRSMAMLAHLGAFVGGFILPLIILVTTGKTDPFVRYHATESLDFQLTYLTFFLGGFLLSLVTLGLGLIVFVPLLIVVAIGHIAFAIQACIAANRGEWYRYPICIRYVKHV